MKAYCAIDPGRNSAAAIIVGDKLDVFVFPQDASRFFLGLAAVKPSEILIGIEKVHAVYHASAASTFSFGKNYGYWLGVLDVYRLPYVDIDIQAWQGRVTDSPDRPKTRGLPKSERDRINREHKKALKMESFRAASEAFPKMRFPSHDVTDAVNMARFLKLTSEVKPDAVV